MHWKLKVTVFDEQNISVTSNILFFEGFKWEETDTGIILIVKVFRSFIVLHVLRW